MDKNNYQEYEIQDVVFEYESAPLYKGEEILNPYEIVKKVQQGKIEELSADYIINKKDGTTQITTKPKLYKYEVDGNTYADIFFNLKVIVIPLEESQMITIYSNYHGLDGNVELDGYFYIERVNMILEGTPARGFKGMLFDPMGEILGENIEANEIADTIIAYES